VLPKKDEEEPICRTMIRATTSVASLLTSWEQEEEELCRRSANETRGERCQPQQRGIFPKLRLFLMRLTGSSGRGQALLAY
jgi:hypothetical protein